MIPIRNKQPLCGDLLIFYLLPRVLIAIINAGIAL